MTTKENVSVYSGKNKKPTGDYTSGFNTTLKTKLQRR